MDQPPLAPAPVHASKPTKPRAAQACTVCRRQKMRVRRALFRIALTYECDGNSPCGRCAKNGHACEYEAPINGISPAAAAALESRIATLEARLEMMERRQAMYEQQRPPFVPQPPSAALALPTQTTMLAPMPFVDPSGSRFGDPPPSRYSDPMAPRYAPPVPGPSSRMNLSNLLQGGPLDEPEAKRRRTLSLDAKLVMRKRLDIIDGGIVSEDDARQFYHRYLNAVEPEFPHLGSAPKTFEDARARSPLYFAVCCTVGARVWPQSARLYAALLRESNQLVQAFLQSDLSTKSEYTAPSDLLACVILATTHGLHRLVTPIVHVTQALKLDRLPASIAAREADGIVTPDLIEELRIFMQARTFINSSSVINGTTAPRCGGAADWDGQAQQLAIHKNGCDPVLRLFGRVYVDLAILGEECSAARRSEPVDWDRLCDRVEAHLAAEEAADEERKAIDVSSATRGVFARQALSILRCLWHIFPRSHIIGRPTTGQELLDHPRRLGHAKQAVELTNAVLETMLASQAFTMTGRWLADAIMSWLRPVTALALSVALALPRQVDADRLRDNLVRFADAFKTAPGVDSYRQTIDKLFSGGSATGRTAVSFERGPAPAESDCRALDDEQLRLLEALRRSEQ